MNRYARDLIERALASFGEAFCAALILSSVGAPGLPTLSIVEKAAGAGVVALLALFKGLCASFLGDHNSAAVLPGPNIQVDHNPVPALPSVSPEEAFASYTVNATPKRRARKS